MPKQSKALTETEKSHKSDSNRNIFSFVFWFTSLFLFENKIKHIKLFTLEICIFHKDISKTGLLLP